MRLRSNTQKYQGKEIKLAFYAKDDFKVLTERPARN